MYRLIRAPGKFRLVVPLATMLIAATGYPWPVRLQEKATASVPSTGKEGCAVAPAQPGQTESEAARIVENMYVNDFYGLTYEFPKSWFVNRNLIEYDLNQKKKYANPPDPKDKTAYGLWLDIQCNHLLLYVSKDPENTPSNKSRQAGIPYIHLTVSDFVFREGIRTGKDWLNSRKEFLDGTSQVIRDPTDYVFAGQLFSRMDLKVHFPPLMSQSGRILSPSLEGYEADVVGVRNGYWIMFGMVAENPQQLEELFKTLDSLKFK